MSVIAKFHSRQNAPLPAGWDTLFSAVLSDALDAYGAPGYAMSPRMRPLDDSLKMCGRARTGAYMEMPYVTEGTNRATSLRRRRDQALAGIDWKECRSGGGRPQLRRNRCGAHDHRGAAP